MNQPKIVGVVAFHVEFASIIAVDDGGGVWEGRERGPDEFDADPQHRIVWRRLDSIPLLVFTEPPFPFVKRLDREGE